MTVVLDGAAAVPAEVGPAGLLYPRALGAQADLLQRPTPGGFEDYLVYWGRPAEPQVRYRVDVGRAAGLRLVSGVLELLDEAGTPVIRMAAPYLLASRSGCRAAPDACTERVAVSVAIESCAYDADPRGPWRRPVVAPGRSTCTLLLSWPEGGWTYPAILDPSWTFTTGAMTAARADFAATRLPNGQVLLTGGDDSSSTLASAELYDPVTGTFAATGTMAAARSYHLMAPLSNGQVIVTGGSGDTSVELYDAGSFTAGPAAPANFSSGTATLLEDDKVLFVGGYSVNYATGRFVPAGGGGGSWQATAPTGAVRAEHGATRLQDGRVLVTGGCQFSPNTTAELYDPVADAWTPQPNMASRHCGHTSTLLPNGQVFIAGGIDNDWISVAAAELFTPPVGAGQGSWANAAGLNPARSYHGAGLLGSGQVLLVGGLDVFWEELDSARIYDPVADSYTTTASLNDARSYFTLTDLANGTFLAAGGELWPAILDTAEVFTPSELGAACATEGDCSVGQCVDGVCCDDPCDGPCESCLASEKGSGADGVCELLPAGSPDPFCADEGAESCGMTGACGASGVCALYPANTPCGPVSCSSASLTSAVCDGDGGCVQGSVSCEPYLCASATACADSCSSHEDCGASWYCTGGSCEPKLPIDAACVDDAECETGICANGTCATSAGCVTDSVLELAGGQRIDCAPYRCRDGDCLTRCESILDCASGTVCGADGVCGTLPEEPADEGGCATARAGRRSGPMTTALLALGVWLLRRRRRCWQAKAS